MNYPQERIEELATALRTLAEQRNQIVHETAPIDMHPRERWIFEDNRRSGLLAIDQSINGAEQQLRLFQSLA